MWIKMKYIGTAFPNFRPPTSQTRAEGSSFGIRKDKESSKQ